MSTEYVADLGEAASVAEGDCRLDEMADTPTTFADARAAAPRAGTAVHALCRPLDGGRVVGRLTAATQGRQGPHTRDMEATLAAFTNHDLPHPH